MRTVKTVTRTTTSYSSAPSYGSSAIASTRDGQRRAIGELNDRLASYVADARFMGAQNKQLVADVELLKRKQAGLADDVKLRDAEKKSDELIAETNC